MNIAEGSLEESRYDLILAPDLEVPQNLPARWKKSAICSAPALRPF
jgi:hypothetical protein